MYAATVLSLLSLHSVPAAAPRAQVAPFAEVLSDLASPDPGVRLKAVQRLEQAAYPEAAVPLAKLVTDPRTDVQLAAIAAELNIFLAERVVTRKRVGLVVEVRNPIAAEAAFAAGPLAIGARPVPTAVLTALLAGARDDDGRVRLEALYAFGVLAAEASGTARRDLLRTSGPEIAALVGASDPAVRHAAVRVIGRLFARRAHDQPIDTAVGDAVIAALNDGDRAVKTAAMASLGTMRYERAVAALTELFDYFRKGESAEAALDALAHIGNAVSVPLFAAQLSGKSSAFRGIAIEGLARAGDAARIADVQTSAAADRTDGVALAAAFANVLLANGSIDRIVEALTRSKLRDQARAYLIEVAPGRAEAFRRHTIDPDARPRLDVVGILDLAGDSAALSVVEPLMQDTDPQVSRAAERAVARLRAKLDKPAS